MDTFYIRRMPPGPKLDMDASTWQQVKAGLHHCGEQQHDQVVQNSWTDLDFQCSLTVRDHEVAAKELDLVLCTTSKRWRNQQYDWEALHTPEGQREIQTDSAKLTGHTRGKWMSIHIGRGLQDGIHAGLATSFPMKRARKKQGIFTADTWKSLDMRKRAKRLLDSCDVHLLHLDRKASFRPWKDGTDITSSGRLQFLDKMALVLCHLQGLPFRLASKEVRAKVKSDKARFVESVVDKGRGGSGHRLVQGTTTFADWESFQEGQCWLYQD